MEVTLYKNVILNSNYDEVFRTKSLVDTYLSNIDTSKKFSLTIDDTYINLKGSIVVYFSTALLNTFDYNYMVLEDTTTNEKFYCFIDSIDVGNLATRINYSVDVWTTFNEKWSLRDSYVSNSRKTISSEPYALPLEYIGNTAENLGILSLTDSLSIIAEIQSYSLATGGDPNNRNNDILILARANGTTNFGYNSIENIIASFGQLTGGATLDTPYATTRRFFEVLNIWVIPSSFIKPEFVDTSSSFTFHPTENSSTVTGLGYILNHKYDTKVYTYTISGNDNYSSKIKSVGFYSTQFPYIYNGLDKTFEVYTCISKTEYRLYLKYENGVQEITDLFKEEQIFQSVDGETLQLQRLQRKVESDKGIYNAVNGGLQMLTGFADIYKNEQVLSAVNHGATLQGKTRAESRSIGITGINEGVNDVIGGAGSLYFGIQQYMFANSAKYNNIKSVNNFSSGLFNAYIGFCFYYFAPQSLINENEVDKAIKEVGYNVDYFTNSLDLGLTTTNWDFNTIRFSFVRVNGCTTEINKIIKSILMSGTKIWYNSTATEI